MANKPSSSKGAQPTDTSEDILTEPTDNQVEEFKEFINILRVTEGFPEKPTEQEKAVAMDKFLVWLEDGKPKPSLSKKPEVEQILRIYRRKSKGEQYLSYVVKGKSEQVGMETEITYGKTPGGEEDTSIIIGRRRFPNKKYNEKEARELLQKAKRYTESVDLRFVFLDRVIPIHKEENFFGDFDKLVEEVGQKKII